VLELPEVEVLRKDLEKEVVGKRVKDVLIETASIVKPFHRTRPEFVKALEGRKIDAARRRGTAILLDLDDDHTWVIQARGSASLHRETANEDAGEHTHLVVTFTIGGAIHLSDVESEPDVSTGVVPTAEVFELAGISTTGFDPLEDNITWMDFGRRMAEAAMPLKLFFMDPRHIQGIGTVYSDEVLYEAGLRYDRPSDTLSTQEVRRLYRAMQEVIATAMKFRGSSLDDSDADEAVDDEGEASEHLKVYGREGLPSFRSRRPIEKVRVKKGVYSYFDPQSQY
jgi:formamidopyrimidine-DNA glycosylase